MIRSFASDILNYKLLIPVDHAKLRARVDFHTLYLWNEVGNPWHKELIILLP